ncbi:zinc ribbon domain-containing protein [Arthrobacter sp. UYEF6]|uniref:zinc ribbon domain-containing protein n=1 Tax=unclassified Pseudarthrobacter TaxID=2647000 RepID=UPI00339A6E2D
MSYCTNCGGQLAPGARFCTSCGTPQQAPAQQAQAQQPQPKAQQATHENPHQGLAPAPRVTSGAFASVPVSDYVRDGLSVFLLLISMFMVWTYGTTAAGSVAATRIDVILITLVSMFSIAIPYLWRSGVFGHAWDYRKTQLARFAANAPYFVLVLVYLVLELINKSGLGPAMAFGLAGAILAAQPRRAELGSAAADATTDKRWGIALLGFAVVVGVLSVVQFIERMTLMPSVEWASTLATVLLAAANVALLVWTANGASRGHNLRRLIGIGVGVAGTGMALLALIPAVTVTSLNFQAFSPELSIFFWMAFGALAASPSVARICTHAEAGDANGALARTRVLTTLAIIVLALLVVVSALVLISYATYAGYGVAANAVPWVVVIFLAVVGAAGGFVAKSALKQHTRQSYLVTAGYAAVLFILGLVIVIMAATAHMAWNGTPGLLIAFALPVALVLSMFGSTSQREAFRTAGNAVQGGFTFENPAPVWSQPESTTPDVAFQPSDAFQPAPVVHGASGSEPEMQGGGTAVQVDEALARILAESADPEAPPARLYEIAAQFPQARALIAGNPAAYPALLTWLAEQQDPEIDAALAQRRE